MREGSRSLPDERRLGGASFRSRFTRFHGPIAPTRSLVLGLLQATLVVEISFFVYVQGLDVLDARLAYTPGQALSALRAMDAHSRALYRAFNLADLAFIGLYSTLLVTWLRFLAQHDPSIKATAAYWGLIPGAFDLVESVGVALLLRARDPEQSFGLWFAVVGTPLKWVSSVAIAVLVLRSELGLWRSRKRAQGCHRLHF